MVLDMKLAIISDLHGNLSAVENVVSYCRSNDVSSIAILGDVIDYGPHSNEVIELISEPDMKVVCNIRGNHEHAILNEIYDRFSSKRGIECAKYTRRTLRPSSLRYLSESVKNAGIHEFELCGYRFLAVHGNIEDEYWGTLKPTDDLSMYGCYDYVLSGHSHIPHLFDTYHKVNDPLMRNSRKTTFINPGSVGQPRNHDPRAQFVIMDLDNGSIQFCRIPYDIEVEQRAFNDAIDPFYKDRIKWGI